MSASVRAISELTRRAPRFRGLGSACVLINAALLRCGVEPLTVVPMRDGTRMRVDLRSNTERLSAYLGEYDQDLIRTLLDLYDPNRWFLDVGANVGFYSVAIANSIRAKGGVGKVAAFEPFPGNHARLVENIELNELGGYSLTHQCGLSDSNAEASITLREDFVAGSATGNAAIATDKSIDAGFDRVTIGLERLDGLSFDGAIDTVKIDIEGHEDFFLRGAQETLDRHRPTLMMEVNKPYYQARRENDLDALFGPLYPVDYAMSRREGKGWNRIDTLSVCKTIDNVLLIPEERLGWPRFQGFT